MRYFLFKCKFGHVGRDKYMAIDVPIAASDMGAAVKKARKTGGVKRDHKNWCLSIPLEINESEYKKKLDEFVHDPFFEKRTRSRRNTVFADRLIDEPNKIKFNQRLSQRNKMRKSRKEYRKKKSILENEEDKTGGDLNE